MRSILTVAAVAALSLAPRFGFAGETTGPERLGQIVAPFVDQQTLLVVHLDLKAFDARLAIDQLSELFDLSDGLRDRLQAEVAPINVVTQSLPEDATVDAFIVSSLSDMGRLPFFLLLPTNGQTPAAAISSEARRDLEKDWGRRLQTEQIGDALITASPETIERLKKGKPAARPEIAAALEAAGASAARLAFAPSAALRALAETIMPQLPESLGGAPTKLFTQGFEWVAAGVDLPPKSIALRVTVQSADAEHAVALRRELAKVFDAIGQWPQIKEGVPEFDELSKSLLPAVSGDRLKWELTEANGGVEAIVSFITPIVQALSAGNAPR